MSPSEPETVEAARQRIIDDLWEVAEDEEGEVHGWMLEDIRVFEARVREDERVQMTNAMRVAVGLEPRPVSASGGTE